jgi:hypothetical protein
VLGLSKGVCVSRLRLYMGGAVYGVLRVRETDTRAGIGQSWDPAPQVSRTNV